MHKSGRVDQLHSMENKNEKIVSNYEHLQCASSHARSFTCAFCKKGFSNAQALGGHMNIHRRVRAQLKQQVSSDENLLSLDITKTTPPPPPPPPPIEQQQRLFQVIEHKSARKVYKDADQEGQQLTFLAEMRSPSDHHDVKEAGSNCLSRGVEEMVTAQSSSKEELDLELRLAGPDPGN